METKLEVLGPLSPEILPENKITRTSTGRFVVGHCPNPNGRPPGVKSERPKLTKREDGRYWLRRNLELPEEARSPVPFCPADRLTRRAIEEAEKCAALDSVRAMEILHRDAYGSTVNIGGHIEALTVEDVKARLEEIKRERMRLEAGESP